MNKMLLLILSAVAANAATISLNDSSPVQQGSSFDITVQAKNVFAGLDPADVLLAYGFNVAVGNAGIVSFTGETAGPLFTDITAQLNGTPQVAGIASSLLGIGPLDFSGPLTLAILHFTAIGPGQTTIGVSANLSDLNQGLTFLEAANAGISASATVNVQPGAAVPEPSALSLAVFGIGFAGFLKLRRPDDQRP